MKIKTELPPQTRGTEQDDVQRKSRSRKRTTPTRTAAYSKTPACATRNAAPFAKPGSQKRMDACDQRFSLKSKMKQNQLLSGVGAKSCTRSIRTTYWFTSNDNVNGIAKPAGKRWHATRSARNEGTTAQIHSRVLSAYSYRDRSRSEYGGQLLVKAIPALPERHTTMSTGEQNRPNSTYSDMLRATFADIVNGGKGRA